MRTPTPSPLAIRLRRVLYERRCPERRSRRTSPARTPPEEEREHAEAAGLTYLHHPVDGEKLSEEVVDSFRDKVADLSGPVLVHCASGKRSGAMVMMHLGAEQGMSGDEVIEKAASMGFECDTPGLERFVRGYVDRHNGR